MAMFPPGLRFIGGKIGLPGFKPGQRWASPTEPAAAPVPAPAPTLGALTPTPPPSATAAASSATLDAQKAAERARKRAAAGVTLLSGKPAPGATPNLRPVTLLGS